MQYLLNNEARERVSAFYSAVTVLDQALGDHNEQIARTNARIDHLQAQLADADRNKPPETIDAADELADALANDPGVAIRKEWLSDLRKGQAAAVAALTDWRSSLVDTRI